MEFINLHILIPYLSRHRKLGLCKSDMERARVDDDTKTNKRVRAYVRVRARAAV